MPGGVTPGEFVVEPPALINLGFEWHIDGLMLGQNASALVFNVRTHTSYSSSDHNGFRLNPGAESFRWASPPPGVTRAPVDATGAVTLDEVKAATLDSFQRATGQDRHRVLVDYDVFEMVPGLDAKDLATVQRLYKAEDLDFRLRPGSAAIDRGVALPNVIDGFAGAAPDLGALELGGAPPVYGPRPRR